MAIKFKDKARTTLASSIGPTDVTFTVAAATGNLFPAINGASNPTSDYFVVTLADAAGNIEVIKVIHRLSATDVFGSATYPCVRDLDGRNGGGRSWAAGDVVAVRLAAWVLENVVNAQVNLDTHAADASGKHFPTGTRMLFQQTAAPTGWTKETGATYGDSALRINTGAVATGGADAFSAVFGTGKTTASFTLTTSHMPSHSHGGATGGQSADHTHGFSGTTTIESQNHVHDYQIKNGGIVGGSIAGGTMDYSYQTGYTGGQNVNHTHNYSGNTGGVSAGHTHAVTAEGGNAGHSHSLNTLNLKYVDVIIATKA